MLIVGNYLLYDDHSGMSLVDATMCRWYSLKNFIKSHNIDIDDITLVSEENLNRFYRAEITLEELKKL